MGSADLGIMAKYTDDKDMRIPNRDMEGNLSTTIPPKKYPIIKAASTVEIKAAQVSMLPP
jgi:hypothetical protein